MRKGISVNITWEGPDVFLEIRKVEGELVRLKLDWYNFRELAEQLPAVANMATHLHHAMHPLPSRREGFVLDVNLDGCKEAP